MSDAIAYKIITTAISDPSYGQNLLANTLDVINQEGITDSAEVEQIQSVIRLLAAGAQSRNEVVQLFQDQLQRTLAVTSAMKEGLQTTVKQIDEAYSSTMKMYKVTFYLGIALVIFAAILAALYKEALLPTIFGGLGIADLIAFLITKPPERLQNSRASLAQLQGAFFNWFNDFFNWNAYMSTLQQEKKLRLPQMQQISEILMTNTDRTMAMLQNYCKLV